MTRTHGLLKSLLFACLAAFPLVAHGATTTSEFRVLFDSEAGGCVVAGMPGVDQVLNTRVEIDDVAKHAHVVSTSWQECQGALLGPATPIAHSPYNVGYDAATGKLLIETAIPFSAFDPTKMRKMRIGVDAHIGDLAHTALTLPDESFVYFPAPSVGRRRAVAAPGEERVIVLNGDNADWKGLKPKFEGIGGSGAAGLRILNVFAFGDTHTNQLFFLFDVSISLNVPFARNDSYTRLIGESLTVPGPSNAPGVLDNDDGLPLLPLKAKLVAQPPAGTVALNETGGFTYTPDNPNATANDTFKYKAFHTVLGIDIESNTADVTIVTEDEDDSNQAPSFTVGPDVFVNEDSGPQVITNWATGISAGAGEGDQTVAFVITNNSNPGLFENPPTVSSAGVLSFEPEENANGSATITIKLTDNGGTANGGDNESDTQTFTINVEPVNDAPSFSPGPHIVVEDIDGPQSVPWATSISAGPIDESGQALTFLVSNNNPSLFSVQPTISSSGVLSYTPAVGVDGIATVTVELQDDGGTANGGIDTSSPAHQLQITVERAPLITSADNTTFIAGQGNTFLVTTTGRPRPSITQGGTLPAGVTFVDGVGPNKGTGTLSGTPGLLTGGVYPLTFFATSTRGTSPTQNFTLTVNQAPAITSGNAATFTRNAAGSFTITTTAYPTATISLTGTLPAGLSFADNLDGTATISGTPTAAGGSFGGFTVTASNGVGANANQSLTVIINEAPAITSANSTGFNATVAATFTVTTTGFPAPSLSFTGTLPAGITFTDNGNGTASLGGNAVQGSGGVYSITITATNVAGSAPQAFTITVCNQIAVTNPGTTTGTVGTAFSQTFTQTGAVGTATFTTASTLPAGLTLATNGTLSGTPTQFGSFPIVVTVTDVNGCTGIGATYTLVVGCQTITVNNPANANGTAGSAFSETFTESGALGGATFTLATGTLPAGLALATNGVLSGTPTQTGSFPITVLVTDGNGCTGTSATYTLVIGCQTITVSNPANTNGTAASPFSETFTQTNAIGGATFTLASGTLPAGLTLATNGVLSGTPTQTGAFPITVLVTDGNGCTGTSATYTLTIGCQTITVTNPVTTTGTANAAFSQTFTQTGAIGTATFTTASTLPTGLTLSTAGVLSGTPTQTGSFPIVVTVTDANGCTGTSATYNLVIGCQTITVTNPANPNGTVSAPFSETFAQSGSIGTATFTTASTLPAGLTLATNGVLSGTPTQSGSFPIVVTVTDSNGCTGTSATYNLVISCQTITVTNPANATGPAGAPFSETFTQTGAIGGATFTTASTLPT
ncbi:MAG TPA: putative Ig domain-containing protein, partial [Thermoanaerobaculia bacterium]|nr:putative Ig domain-containing protein [Thermoanaerobaculia bacterium]